MEGRGREVTKRREAGETERRGRKEKRTEVDRERWEGEREGGREREKVRGGVVKTGGERERHAAVERWKGDYYCV